MEKYHIHVPSFYFQILDLIYWTVLIFILIYFEWRDTENQQYVSSLVSMTKLFTLSLKQDLIING